MESKRLYLIGTNHFDLKGEARLATTFQTLSPKVIALELSKDRANFPDSYKVRMEEKYRKAIDDSGLGLTEDEKQKLVEIGFLTSKAYGYELNVSKDYVRKNPESRLIYTDMSLLELGLENYEGDIMSYLQSILTEVASSPEGRENLLRLINCDRDLYLSHQQFEADESYRNLEAVSDIYQEISQAKEENPEIELGPFANMFNPKRDEYMSRKIRRIYSRIKSGNLCSIVGLGHVPSIRERIKDLNPIYLSLLEASQLKTGKKE